MIFKRYCYVPLCLAISAILVLLPPPPGASGALIDDFNDSILPLWGTGANNGVSMLTIAETNQQLTLSGTYAPNFLDNIVRNWAGCWPTQLGLTLTNGITQEFKIDLLGSAPNEAFAWLGWTLGGNGYALCKDPDELFLVKYNGGGGGTFSFFWHESQPIPQQNITLAISFTATSNAVEIVTRILDRDDPADELFSRTTIDTVASDPVLPSLMVKGLMASADPPGQLHTGAGVPLLGLWVFSDELSVLADVHFDNFRVNDVLHDDFEDDRFWRKADGSRNTSTILETNGQLVVTAESQATMPNNPFSTYSGVWLGRRHPVHIVDQDQNVEFRVDLVSANQDDVFAMLSWIVSGGGYAFGKDQDELFISKINGSLHWPYFVWDTQEVKHENVTLVMAIRQQAQDTAITAQVLDKEDNNRVLYEATAVDTPATETMAVFPKTGTVWSDIIPPWTGNGLFTVALWHYTDGNQPAAEIVFDNAVLGPIRPLLLIDRQASDAVLSWRDGGLRSFALQWIPTLDSPDWLYAASGRSNPATLSLDRDQAYFRLLEVAHFRIVEQPGSLRIRETSEASFTVGATGEGMLNYQWFFNGSALAGATSDTLSIPNTQASDQGNYHVVVTDDIESATSETASLTLIYPPDIVVQPQDQEVQVGGTVTFSITVTNNATLPVGYRWRHGSETLAFDTLNTHTGTLSITNVQMSDAGSYTVIVTNEALRLPGILSDRITLTVTP